MLRPWPLVMLAAMVACTAEPPPSTDKVATARWMAQTLDWGVLSTTSTRSEGSTPGDPFGNPYSFADASTGIPYFYASGLDASMIDVFTGPKANPRASFALSEATLIGSNNSRADCVIGASEFGDPENPPCARLVLSGTMVQLTANSTEEHTALDALFKKHPAFVNYPPDHHFFVVKLEVDGVWLIDYYGGAAIIPPEKYFAAKIPSEPPRFIPAMPQPALPASFPPYTNKLATARWMATSLDWGVLSTTSTRSEGTTPGSAFGNPYSFADAFGTGIPYFYASALDASMIDVGIGDEASAGRRATFSLSEAAFNSNSSNASSNASSMLIAECRVNGSPFGDPENPPCARLVLSGTIVKLDKGTPEEKTARAALFAKHPSFVKYPVSHDFFVAKLEVDGVWLIDYYGGGSILPPSEYLANLTHVAAHATTASSSTLRGLQTLIL